MSAKFPNVVLNRRTALKGLAGGAGLAAFAPQMAAATAGPTSARPALPAPGQVRDVDDPADLDVLEAAALLQAGQLSSRELTQACLLRIRRRDRAVSAWRNVYTREAQLAAAAADRRLSAAGVRRDGPAPVLCGVPIGLKDILAVEGFPLTAGSEALADNVATGNGDAWERLSAQGMVLLGHTRTQEFATGAAPQTAGNPFDPAKSPGGSSNGSGAAVGARTAPVTLGTDLGGSLRRPASACNLATMMATYGRVSTRGMVTSGRSADHVGPLTRSLADTALMLTYLAGPDPQDPSTYSMPELDEPYPTTAAPDAASWRGARIGVPTALPSLDELDPGIRAVFERFLDEIEEYGAELVELDLPAPPPSPGPTPEQILLHRDLYAEAGDLYTPYNRRVIGEQQAAADSLTALELYEFERARGAYIAQVQELLHAHDVAAVAQPTQTAETPVRGTTSDDEGDVGRFGDGVVRSMYNQLGFPSLSIPAGLSPETGMPVGAQLSGLPMTDASLLQLGIDYQSVTEYHRAVPEDYS